MVQNISAVRFGNYMIESMWNSRYIDNIQITLSESLGVEERGGYYDTSGALRDMLQNHIISLLAMEPPTRLEDKEIRTEKIKALKAVRLLEPEEVSDYMVRGQYGPGINDISKNLNGYREEANVAPDSQTETFVAGKIMIDNFRWTGVPFYFRTGKRLTKKGTQIDIEFKNVPLNLFDNNEEPLPPNVLTIYIQPTEGFSLELNTKKIGLGLETETLKLEHKHSADTTANSPEAYEKLILDCLNGDSTNFTHWDEVATSWKFVDIIRERWDNEKMSFPNYASGSMGPTDSEELLIKDGFKWHWCPNEK